ITFFFQEEDGIRDFHVTGVQTCALPICLENELAQLKAQAADINTDVQDKEELFESIDRLGKSIDEKIEEILEEIRPEAFAVVKRSEERRVGKECRDRWATHEE